MVRSWNLERARGRWLGFDEISSGHRIYWEDKRNVTVERSISFETRDAVLEGELDGYVRPAPPDFKFDEQPDVNDNEESDSPAVDAPVDESKTEEAQDDGPPEAEAPAALPVPCTCASRTASATQLARSKTR